MARAWMEINVPGFVEVRTSPEAEALCLGYAEAIRARAEALSHGSFEVEVLSPSDRCVVQVSPADDIAAHDCFSRNVLLRARG